MCERRNLFTHTRGVVSPQYINVCAQNGITAEHNLGDKIDIGPEYFDNCVSTVVEFGLKLHQIIWRKLRIQETLKAEGDLFNIIRKFSRHNEDELCCRLASFVLSELRPPPSAHVRLMLTLYKAASEKNLGNESVASKTLAREDWTVLGDNYRAYAYAIKDESDKLLDLVPKAFRAGSITANELLTASAFRPHIEEGKLLDLVREIVGTRPIKPIS